MLKTLLLPALIVAGLTQTKNLGTYYELNSARNGKSQELTLYKTDSFCYKIQEIMVLKGRYRVSGDSLVLATGTALPIIFQIKRNKLAAFNDHGQAPEWYLTKIR